MIEECLRAVRLDRVGRGNLAKTRRATAAEVEQVIANADSFTRSRHAAHRVLFELARMVADRWWSWLN
jgi:hypothetical protein